MCLVIVGNIAGIMNKGFSLKFPEGYWLIKDTLTRLDSTAAEIV